MFTWEMSKFCLGFLIVVVLLCVVVGAVRINEVELNPEGTDAGNEWIELYSNSELNLTGWKIINEDNDEIELNGSFSDYFIINLPGQWLDNSDERVFLVYNNTNISQSDLFSDSYNDNRTWQYCDGDWSFMDYTKGSENSCEDDDGGSDNDITLEMEWDEDDIINGRDFKIKIKAYNLEDKYYDIKIHIMKDDEDTIISDRYDKENDDWRSGKYYIYGFFSGPGDESESVKLRIRDAYENYRGDARIFLKLGGEDVEEEEEIEILRRENRNLDESIIMEEEDSTQNESAKITGDVIRLNEPSAEESEETEESDVGLEGDTKRQIYKSKIQYIKDYAIYWFSLFCVLVIIFLIWKRR